MLNVYESERGDHQTLRPLAKTHREHGWRAIRAGACSE